MYAPCFGPERAVGTPTVHQQALAASKWYATYTVEPRAPVIVRSAEKLAGPTIGTAGTGTTAGVQEPATRNARQVELR